MKTNLQLRFITTVILILFSLNSARAQCVTGLSTYSLSAGSGGGLLSAVTVNPTTCLTYSVSTTYSWLSYTTQGPRVNITAQSNPGATRTGYVYIGGYQVTVTQSGCDPLSAPTSISTNRNNICSADGGTITLTPSGGQGTTVRWFSGSCSGPEIGTSAGPSGSLVISAPTSTTTYYAREETGCGASGCAAITINVTPSQPVSITISGNSTLCGGQSGMFTASVSNGGSSQSYQWLLNGNNVTNNTIGVPVYVYAPNTPLAAGSQVSCVFTSNASCVTSNPATSNIITISWTNPVTPSVGVTTVPSITGADGNGPYLSICNGTSVTFTANASNGGNFQWYSTTRGLLSGQTGTTYTYAGLTNDERIYVTETGITGCVSSSSATSSQVRMIVNPVLTPSVAISPLNPTAICSGNNITFTATPTNGGSSPTYVWKVNGAVQSGQTGTTFSSTGFTNGQIVSVEMTSNNPCQTTNFSSASSGAITVNPPNTITLTSGAGTDAQSRCVNTAITPITYSTTGATGATISGLPTGVTGGWASNVYTISGTPTATGTFNYTITLTGGCGTVTKTGSITVSINTINLTSAAGTDAQTKCINTVIIPITYSTTGATGATITGLPSGVTGGWASNVYTISGTPTASGTFNYTITLTGGCGTVTKTGSIIVLPNNTITLSSSAGTDAQTRCINTAITNITYSTTGATGATITGLPAGVSGAWASNVYTISGTPTASGTFNYTITLTGGCSTVTKTGSIIVTPANTIALTSAAGTDAQTKCINTAITNITYSTTGATGATITGLPAGVTGAWASNVYTISGTPTTSGTFNYTITLTGGCSTVTKTGSIIVSVNTITLTSAAGTDAQTKCINTAITPITYSTTGATGATITGLPAGVTGGWASNVYTISGTPTASGTFNYTITLTGGCGTVTKTGSIIILPNNTITLTSAAGTDAQTRCINTAITNITYSTTGATGATITGLPAGVTGAWASNVYTISGTPTASGTFNYTITLTGGCSTVTKAGSIIVTPANTITLTSAAGTDAQTKCINTAITNITYSTTGATGATITGLPAGVTGAWASNVYTISGTPTASGTFNYTITLTGGCSTVTKTGSIIVSVNTITLTSAAGTDAQTRCINTAITNITYSTTGATGATITGLPAGVSGAWASNVYTISGTPTASGTFNYTITLTGGCGTVTKTGSIIVNPVNTITLTSAAGTDAQTKCINTALTNITYSTTGATGATITGLPAGVTGAWASNVYTISGTPTASGTFNYTITLTGGCSTVTKTGSIIVTPANTIALTSAAGTDAQTKCINTAITNITYSTTGATGATITGLPAGVTGAWVSNVYTISGTPTASGTFNYTITLTGGCSTVTKTGSIIVSVNTITLTSAVGTDAQTKCVNTAITNITYSTTGATGATITGLPAGVTGAWASNVYTISGTPTASGVFNYTITLTGGCGTVTKTGTITVSVNTITLTSAAGTDAQTKCINTALTNITYSTTGATGATITGLPAGVTGAWASNVYTISGTPTASGTFNYTITLTGGCSTVTKTGSIVVSPVNTITLTSAAGTDAQTKCVNTAITNITYSTTGATGATITGLPAGVTGAWASNVYTISGTPTASGTYNYTITLTGGCSTVTKTGSINVTIANTITLTSAAGTDAQTKCINTAITNITYSTTGATGATITGLPAGVTGGWASNVYTISGTPTVSGTFNYTITLTGGCSTVTKTGSIIVTPVNTITLTSAAGTDAQTKCINTAITNITYSTTGATGATITGLPAGVTGAWASNVYTISGTPTVSGTFNYTITLTGGCSTVTKTGSIIVSVNTITLTSAAGTDAQTKCISTAITNITYSTTGATGATITGIPAGVTGSWASNVYTISGTPTASGTFNYTITLTGGCGTVTKTGSIIVTTANTITLTSAAGTDAQTKCLNTAITNITYSTTGATGATITGLPAGVTGGWASNVYTISGTPTVSGTFSYTITLTGGCSIVTKTGSITVTPSNTITLTSAAGTDSQTININSPVANITYSTTGATGATVTGLPAGVNGVWASNVYTISGTPTSSGTFNYTITLTGGCSTVTKTGSVIVIALNTITLTSAAGTDEQSVQNNSPITNITYSTTGATGATVTGLPSGVTGTWTANVVTISGTPTTEGSYIYIVTLTGGSGSITKTGGLTVTPPASFKAQYNGNISAIKWKSTSFADNQLKYDFHYDALNRLFGAEYLNFSTPALNGSYNEDNIWYDLNGNIRKLRRTGITLAGSMETIDNIIYNYNGNMLTTIADTSDKAFGFIDSKNPGNDYVFDSNGNMTEDKNKGITIEYNILNLPLRITKGTDYIEYTYDATGTKLSKKVKIGSSITITDYCGDTEFQGDLSSTSIKYLHTEEGVVEFTSPSVFSYEYFLKDHLGSTRAVVSLNSGALAVNQVNSYYPFGMLHTGIPRGINNKYLYNGKEMQDEAISGTNLDWYDYGARFYDPQIGRWDVVDRLSESYYESSPYHFSGNNPLNIIDIDGMDYSPIFDKNANFLGTDDQGMSGDIIVADDPSKFKQNMKHSDAIKIGSKFSSSRTDLTEDAKVSIISTILEGTDLPDNSKIKKSDFNLTLKKDPDGIGDYTDYNYKDNKHIINLDLPDQEWTVENVRISGGVHEIYGHGIKKWSDRFFGGGTHRKGYEAMMDSKYWNGSTEYMKRLTVKNYWDYFYNEVIYKTGKGSIPERYKEKFNKYIRK